MVGPFYEFVDESLLQKFNITRPEPQECWAFIDYVAMIRISEPKTNGLVWIIRNCASSDPDPTSSILVPDSPDPTLSILVPDSH